MEQKKPTKSAGRKCSICTHEKVSAINSAIAKGDSFRSISLNFWGNDSHRFAVSRHSENCLKLEIQALLKEKKIKNAVDHFEEINAQLEFARDLRIAARSYLTHPETGEITLIPRSDEIEVVYEEYCLKGAEKGWVKKTEQLDVLLGELDEDKNVLKTKIKHVDIRSFALDAIRAADLVLDKIAKLRGLYQLPAENEQRIERAAKAIVDLLQNYPGTTLDEVVPVFCRARALDPQELKRKVIEEFKSQGLSVPSVTSKQYNDESGSIH